MRGKPSASQWASDALYPDATADLRWAGEPAEDGPQSEVRGCNTEIAPTIYTHSPLRAEGLKLREQKGYSYTLLQGVPTLSLSLKCALFLSGFKG